MKIKIGTEILIILSTPKIDSKKLIITVKITIFSYLKEVMELKNSPTVATKPIAVVRQAPATQIANIKFPYISI